jgi:transposase
MNQAFETYWGIDVSKEWLDIDIGTQTIRILQTEKSLQDFIQKHPLECSNTLVVLESTGGYEQLAVRVLSAAGLVVHIAHPNKVKAFAKAKGRLAKTDKIDAKLLRAYGSFIQAKEIRNLPSGLQKDLELLGSRLSQLKAMHHQESCRLGLAGEASVKRSIQSIVDFLKEEIDSIQQAILQAVNSRRELKEKYALLQSMKGVGPQVALKLLTDLPELGTTNQKEIAALVGVAPITNTSGQKQGRAMIKYGRSEVRKVLYMGALVASRYEPRLQIFYKKLLEKGKPPKVALVAVMRKMIVILNAMLQSKKPFQA